MVNIVTVGDELQIFWTEPNNGGDDVTEYQLELYIPLTQDYVLDTVECDGSNLVVLTAS